MAELKIEVRTVELPDGRAQLPVAFVDAGGVTVCVALLHGQLIAVHKHPYQASTTYDHVPDARPLSVCSPAPKHRLMGQLHAALTATQAAWEIASR